MDTSASQRVVDLPIDKISRSPYQPREIFDEAKIAELADSIRESGLLQPIIVRKKDEDAYELIAGERRLQAHLRLGRATIPGIVRDVSDEEAHNLVLIENLQREDLTIMEEARCITSLVAHHQGNRQLVAQKIGKSVGYVTDRMSFLSLPKEIQEMLDKGEITIAQAKVILELDSEAAQKKAAKLAVKLTLNASQLRGRMQKHLRKGSAPLTERPTITFDQLSNGLIRLYDALDGYNFAGLGDTDKRETLKKQLELVSKVLARGLEELVTATSVGNGIDIQKPLAITSDDTTQPR